MAQTRDVDFNKRATEFDEGIEGRASQRFYNLLLREVELRPQAAVLDVGCGTGALLSRFAATCDIVGFGIDIAEEMLNVARDKCPQMVFHVARCDDMPFDDQSFDVITACMAYHHFDNKLGFASEAARVIKPGGILYIADPRFPWFIRKTMNGALRLLRIAGEFATPQEMAERFGSVGFTDAGVATDAYAQVVKLRRE